MMPEVRLATRRSSLAMAQTRRVADLLQTVVPDLAVRLVEIDTAGDRDRSGPIARLTELGAFVRGVQEAVIDGRADLAVHSLKDLPVTASRDLVLAAFPERASPFDVMVGSSVEDLPEEAVVGTGSPRRAAQLARHRPGIRTTELRGNVDTRLAKIEAGEVDAAVFAEAGLERLGRSEMTAQRFAVEEMVPAPGQGALAVEARPGTGAAAMAGMLDDARLRSLLMAERELLAQTGAGCRSSLGVLARWEEGRMRLDAFVSDERGPRQTVVVGDDAEAVVAGARKELGL
ncbi:MAG TPA: hydroxymethylbilane synthase [Acidimicrobiia bacterium]|nr:hydroxymethylbilane synthase [Acidimicrobiia bacterium]